MNDKKTPENTLQNSAIMHGDIVRLRAISHHDLDMLRVWVNSESVRKGLNKIMPVTPEGHEMWFENLKTDKSKVGFAIEAIEDNRLAGAVFINEIDPYNRRAMITIFIGDESERGKGYGGEAVKLAVRYGFNFLNLNRIGLLVAVDNTAAVRCYEGCGFKHEGILRSYFYFDSVYRDVVSMSVLRDEFEIGHNPI